METSDDTDNEPSSSPAPTTPGTARFAELKALVATMEGDFAKFYGDGNKAAGTRVRNAMQALKGFAQRVRTEVQDLKNKPGAS